MAIHKVTLLIEVPDDFDDMWEGPNAGHQIVHDLLITNSMSGLLQLYAACADSPQLAEYLLAKFKMVENIKVDSTDIVLHASM